MAKIRFNILDRLIIETVSFFFIMMLNPRFRGKNFKFESFDISEYTINCINLTVLRLTSEEENYIIKNSELRWKDHIEKSGVLEWIHLQGENI